MNLAFGALVVLKSWWSFMMDCEQDARVAEDLAMQRYLQTLSEEELRDLLEEQ